MKNTLKNTDLLFIFLSFFMVNLTFTGNAFAKDYYLESNIQECPSPMDLNGVDSLEHTRGRLCSRHKNKNDCMKDKEKTGCTWTFGVDSSDHAQWLCVKQNEVYGSYPFSSQNKVSCENGEIKYSTSILTGTTNTPNPILLSDLDYDCSAFPRIKKIGSSHIGQSFTYAGGAYIKEYPDLKIVGYGLFPYSLDGQLEYTNELYRTYNGKVFLPVDDKSYIFPYQFHWAVIVPKTIKVGQCHNYGDGYGDGSIGRYLGDIFGVENYQILVWQTYMGNLYDSEAEGTAFRDNLGGAGSGLGINIPNSKYPDKVTNPYK